MSDPYKSIRSIGPLFGAGIQLAAAVVVMFFAGRWLDEKIGTTPWFMLLGAMAGAGGGMYAFFRTVSEVEDREKRKSSEQ